MAIEVIQNKIFELRGQKIIFDFDLAKLYQVETKRLNEQVKRNKERFPADFMFRLNKKEWDYIRSQIATASNNKKSMRSQIATASQSKRNVSVAPYAFTEHGVGMAAMILKSDRAVKMSIAIVRAFIALRKFAINYDALSKEIAALKKVTGSHNIQLSKIYDTLENLMDEKAEQKTWEERKRIGFKSNQDD